MARKQPLRPGGASAVPVGANDGPEAVEAAIVRLQALGERALATAALLPMLDRAAASGHGASRLAAALLRSTAGAEAVVMDRGAPEELIADKVERLATLVREQDALLSRLLRMLDAVV